MSWFPRTQTAELRWEFAPEWQDLTDRSLLFGPQGLRLEQWLANGQARIVKHA
jgi:hypothetical protein